MDALLQDIESFIESHDMPPTTFGNKALNDPNFVFDLRNGTRDYRRSTAEKVRNFIKNYQ